MITDPNRIRPLDTPLLCGDASKAMRILGWKPKVKLEQMIAEMVDKDMARWQGYLEGVVAPWDALNAGEL